MVDFSQERECGWFKWVALREGEEQVECSGLGGRSVLGVDNERHSVKRRL